MPWPNTQKFTDTDRRLAVKMFREGKTRREIAEVIGCTPSWVSVAVKRAGFSSLRQRQRTPEDVELNIVADFLGGMERTEIAKKYGCAKATISSVLQRKGAVRKKAKKKDLVTRVCLGRCGKTFASTGNHNRICSSCKNLDSIDEGEWLGPIHRIGNMIEF